MIQYFRCNIYIFKNNFKGGKINGYLECVDISISIKIMEDFWMFSLLCVSLFVSFFYTTSYCVGELNLFHGFEEVKEACIEFAIISFFVHLSWIFVFLYISCKPYTLLVAYNWMWPALIIDSWIYNLIFWNARRYTNYIWFYRSSAFLAFLMIIMCVFSELTPRPKLVDINRNLDINTRSVVSSEELIEKFSFINPDNENIAYTIVSPQILWINKDEVMVYQIESNFSSNSIPGFIIQKENNEPVFIQKRICFDVSLSWNSDAKRAIRMKYPTIVIGEHRFDIDDNYVPYEIFSYKEDAFLLGNQDYGVIALNLTDGTIEMYSATKDELPDWIDFKAIYPR